MTPKTPHTKSLQSTIIVGLMIMLVSLMFVSLVSAAEDLVSWDNDIKPTPNVTSVYPKYPDVDIMDKSWIGEDTKLASYKITSHTEQCLIDCYTEGYADMQFDGKLFDSIAFSTMPKEYKVYVEESYQIDVQDYITDACKDVLVKGDGLLIPDYTYKNCSYIKNGTHKETRYRWKEYRGELLRTNVYHWRIEGKKNIGEKIDWIPTVYGKEISNWAWWNEAWIKKKAITLNVTFANENQTSTLINVTFDDDMQADFDDLRFTDSAETNELGYWFENNTYQSATKVQVWVGTGDLNSTENKTIYMYYGNGDATTTSNIKNAFLMGDDFLGTSLSANWTGDSASFVVGAGIVNHTAGGAFKYMRYVNNGAELNYSDYIMESRMSATDVTGVVDVMVDLAGTLVPERSSAVAIHASDFLTGVNGDTTGGTPVNNIWYRGLFSNPPSGNAQAHWTADNGGADLQSKSANPVSRTTHVMLEGYTKTGSWDWIYMRRHLPAEPAFTFGDEINFSTSAMVFYTTLLSPNNNVNLSSSTNWFNSSASILRGNLTNATLYVWSGATAYTNLTTFGSSINYTSANLTLNLADGEYNWSYQYCGTNSTSTLCVFNNTNRTFTIDTTLPKVYITYPLNTTYATAPVNITFNATDLRLGTCIIGNETVNYTESCNGMNNSLIAHQGSNRWYMYANDTFGNFNSTSVTFFMDSVKPTVNISYPLNTTYTTKPVNITFNASDLRLETCIIGNESTNFTQGVCDGLSTQLVAHEGGNQWYIHANDTFGNFNSTSVLFSVDTINPIPTILIPSNFVYNNSNVTLNYSVAETNLDACWYSLNGAANVSLASCANNSILLTARNNSLILYANDTFGREGSATSYPYYFPYLTICNSTNNLGYVNFSFKNETTGQEAIDATFTSLWTYWFDSLITRTLSFTNLTANPSYSFCIDGGDETLNGTVTLQYGNANAYPRGYYESFSWANITNNRTLFLLPTGSGQYVTFTVVDSAYNPVANALVNITLFTGEFIESKIADDLGVAIFYLNPLTSYTIIGSKTGLGSSTQTYAPVLTAYNIVLGGTITTINTTVPTIDGITWAIKPTGNYLENNTAYLFNYTIASSGGTLTSYGFTITNGSTTFATASGSSSTGGMLNATLNTGTNQTFVMNAWYLVNGEYGNFTKVWYIYDSSGDGWSIKNFFTDLKTYSGEGMFGLTSFGLSIIIFLIILTITGIMAYKFSLSSPAMVVGILFLLVLIFDVGLGMIDNPVSAIPHFPTALIGLIMAGLFFKEVTE